jgi:anti-sigma B factor antagonist
MLRWLRRRKRRHEARDPDGGGARASKVHSSAGRLRLEITEGARSARMALYGEFDLASAADASRALQELLSHGLDKVIVDLSGLQFMDSTGVKFLVDGRETALARGVKLSLVHGGDPVERVLTVSGVAALFEDVDIRRSG